MSGIADVSFTPRRRKGTDPIKVCYISDSDCKDTEITEVPTYHSLHVETIPAVVTQALLKEHTQHFLPTKPQS